MGRRGGGRLQGVSGTCVEEMSSVRGCSHECAGSPSRHTHVSARGFWGEEEEEEVK